MFAIFVVMSYKFLLNFLMPAFCLSSLAFEPVSRAQEYRTWMSGGVFSPKEVGVSVTVLKPDKTSLCFGIAADMSDVLYGSPVRTGVRLSMKSRQTFVQDAYHSEELAVSCHSG